MTQSLCHRFLKISKDLKANDPEKDESRRSGAKADDQGQSGRPRGLKADDPMGQK